MKKITIQIAIEKGKIVSAEHTVGLDSLDAETHLLIIGALENLKAKHLDKLKTKFEATRKIDKLSNHSEEENNGC